MVDCRFCGNEIDPSSAYCNHCGRQLRTTQPTPTQRKPTWPWVLGVVIIAAILILAALSLWPGPNVNDGQNDSNDPNEPLPAKKTILDLSNEHYSGGRGEGFGCKEPGTSGLGCKIDTVYEEFKITWSASAPMYLEVGTNEDSRKWFCMGHACASAKSSGSKFVSADWSVYGNVWFHWGNDDNFDDMTVYELEITAIR